MPESYVLSIDQGTTGTTALLFDPQAKLVSKAYEEFSQHYPQAGWVEHDAEEIFRSTVTVCRYLLKSAGIDAKNVVAAGLTNQRETVVIWDRQTGKPVGPAIVWQCRRTTDVCSQLKQKGLEPEIVSLTGLVLDPYFSATKIAWILDHTKGLRKRAEKGELAFGTIDSWLIFGLSKGKSHLTDFTNASRTLLFDIHKRDWSPRLCEIFNVPMALLPQVTPSSHNITKIDARFFGHEIPICGVAGDQQAALYGHGAVRAGMTKCTFGTGAFAVSYTGCRCLTSQHGLLSTLACDENGRPAYALEGSIFMAGATIQWLRDELKLIEKASETEEIAYSIPDSGGVYLVPAFVGLGAPHWDPTARGAILGLTRGTNRAHLVRAALESIAHQVVDLIHAMEKDQGNPISELSVDGGAVQNGFLMQHLADLLDKPVIRPHMLEMTAFGAAKLAARAKDLWTNDAPLSLTGDRFNPKMTAHKRRELREGWTQAVERVLNP